jgi:shikimate dehydrogenase
MTTPPLRFAVIGSPVAHSKSPRMHAAAYAALGMPHAYERIETSAEEVALRVEALRRGDFAGLNVTVPHKTRVLSLVDEIDPSAKATGAANTLVRVPAGVRAHNTDAPAIARELVRLRGSGSFAGTSAVVIGSGGAARAAIYALGTLGVARVIVRARREVPALADVLVAAGSRATLSFSAFSAPAEEPSDLSAIVQATTGGMEGAPLDGQTVAGVVAWDSVPGSCVVFDVVYAPPRTPLVDRAAARGLTSDGGLGMLVGQGALAFELWLGVAPPLDVMQTALML